MNVTIKTWTKVLTLGLLALLFTACTSGGNKSDTTPDSFSLSSSFDTSAVNFGEVYEASTTIQGINKPVAISITGGEYKIGEAGTYTSASGEVKSGDTVYVRVTASTAELTASTATLSVNGVSSSLTVTTKADDVPPEVTVGTPPTTEEITGDTITLTGTASDAQSGVESVSVKVGAADPLDAALGEGGAWGIELPVAIGENTIVVTVTDAKGVQTVNEPIIVTKADDAPPVLVVTSHADNSSVTGDAITLSGTVTDEHSTVASVTVAVNGGDAIAATIEAGSWTAAGLPIIIGANTVTAFASDSVGNVSETQTLTLNKADKIKPVVAISTPANAAVLTTETTEVTGTASDEHSSVTAITLTAKANDAEAVTLSAESITLNTDGSWSATGVPVAIGSNVITATSTDEAGNVSEAASITVTKADDVKPSIAITSHAENEEVVGDTITVSGTSSDNYSGVVNVSLSAKANDADAVVVGDVTPDAEGNWSIGNVPVEIGSNVMTVTATDGADPSNEGVASVTVIKLDDKAPTVEIKFPPPVSMTEGETVYVRVTAADEHGDVESVNIDGNAATFVDVEGDGEDYWWYLVTLPEISAPVSATEISVTATDSIGNVSEVRTVNVTRDTITSAFPSGSDVFSDPHDIVISGSGEEVILYVSDPGKSALIRVYLDSPAAQSFSDNTLQEDTPFAFPAWLTVGGGKIYASDLGEPKIYSVNLNSGQRSIFIDSDTTPELKAGEAIAYVEGDKDELYFADTNRISKVEIESKSYSVFSSSFSGVPNSDVPLSGVSSLYYDSERNTFIASGASSGEVYSISNDASGVGLGARSIIFDQSIPNLFRFVSTGNENEYFSSSRSTDKVYVINTESDHYDETPSMVTTPMQSESENAYGNPRGIATLSRLGFALVADQSVKGVLAMDKVTGWRVIISKSAHTP